MKRGFDIIVASIVLLLSAPICLVAALLIKLDSKGTVWFIQQRVGRNRRRKPAAASQYSGIEHRKRNLFGKPLYMYKFRTMVAQASTHGPKITAQDDNRITRVGKILRNWKLDEIPQFYNVLKGDMSIVGPRPEIYDYVQHYSVEQLQVLDVKPGITDLASIKFRNESQLLAQCDNIQDYYIQTIMPKKLQLNMIYLKRRSLFYDTFLILQTVKAILFN